VSAARVLGIDPGTHESGFALFGDAVEISGVLANQDLKTVISRNDYDVLAIEKIVSYGSAVGQETFDTCVWVGRFMEWSGVPDDVLLIPRRVVVKHMCGSGRWGDSHVRSAVIRRLGAPGTKKSPGPTYGVKSHAWQALAVALTAQAEMG
jgi:hypothetical protein